jgi:hypothetical protein
MSWLRDPAYSTKVELQPFPMDRKTLKRSLRGRRVRNVLIKMFGTELVVTKGMAMAIELPDPRVKFAVTIETREWVNGKSQFDILIINGLVVELNKTELLELYKMNRDSYDLLLPYLSQSQLVNLALEIGPNFAIS